jgi:hypothetical protein
MEEERAEPLVRFEYPVTVEARQPRFEPLASLQFLDLEQLSSGAHELEIGSFQGGCCRQMVRAIIREGMVTDIDVEQCKGGEEPSPALAALFDEAPIGFIPTGRKSGSRYR